MSISFMISALLAVSLLTNLTVEGIKKLLDENNVKYSSNVLAAIFSTIFSGCVCAGYLIMNDVVLSIKIGVEIAVLMYLGFLVSTVGYDKVIQTLKQLQVVKEDTENKGGN